mmetsp:Transcript_18714/g.38945  ORF Transcript_18714/g.38945 Transcript_18714/m.38945 type:complete len:476 (+) Transcript_18714:138-1565(+)
MFSISERVLPVGTESVPQTVSRSVTVDAACIGDIGTTGETSSSQNLSEITPASAEVTSSKDEMKVEDIEVKKAPDVIEEGAPDVLVRGRVPEAAVEVVKSKANKPSGEDNNEKEKENRGAGVDGDDDLVPDDGNTPYPEDVESSPKGAREKYKGSTNKKPRLLPFSREEDLFIVKKYNIEGMKYTEIEKLFPERSHGSLYSRAKKIRERKGYLESLKDEIRAMEKDGKVVKTPSELPSPKRIVKAPKAPRPARVTRDAGTSASRITKVNAKANPRKAQQKGAKIANVVAAENRVLVNDTNRDFKAPFDDQMYTTLDATRFPGIAMDFPAPEWEVQRTHDGHYKIFHQCVQPPKLFTSLSRARQYKQSLDPNSVRIMQPIGYTNKTYKKAMLNDYNCDVQFNNDPNLYCTFVPPGDPRRLGIPESWRVMVDVDEILYRCTKGNGKDRICFLTRRGCLNYIKKKTPGEYPKEQQQQN